MDIRDMTAPERAAYVRGLDDGARKTRETIAYRAETAAKGWRDRPSTLAADAVATTLEGLAEALRATEAAPTPADASPYATSTPGLVTERDRRIVADLHRFAGRPTPAEALAQDAAEDAAESDAEDEIERMRRGGA